MDVQRIGISLESDLLEQFDHLIREKGYSNRSEAVRDLIRDKFITEEAYRRGIDRDVRVKLNIQMWDDALVAAYYRNQLLKQQNIKEENFLNAIEGYLNSYVNDLQKKYDDQIEINVEEFNKIKLTNINMISSQINVPYPVMVPSFPQLTDDDKLDYGKKLINR